MSEFGQYRTTEQLHSDALVSVWKATAGAGRRQFVLKEFRPAAGLVSESKVKQGLLDFVERAELLRELTDIGQHWAQMIELVHAPSAYCVLPLYPSTARRLILSRAQLGEAELFSIVSGVVAGLLELRAKCDRAHGNLKPENVLLGARGKDRPIDVRLSDPCARWLLGSGRAAERRDLHAIGELIHLLVMQRPADTAYVGPSEAWTRLGAKGEMWRSLCNDLIAADADRLLAGLDELRTRVNALVPHRSLLRRLPIKSLAAASVVGLAAAGAGGMVLRHAQANARVHAHVAMALWHDRLVGSDQAPGDAARYRDLTSARLGDASTWSAIEASDRVSALTLNYRSIRQAITTTRASEAAVKEVRRGLVDAWTEVQHRLNQHATEYGAQGYASAEEYLRSLVNANAPADPELIDGIDTRLQVLDALAAHPKPEVPQSVVELKRKPDRDLHAFGAALEAGIPAASTLSKSGWTIDAQIGALASRVLKVQSWPDGYDRTRLVADHPFVHLDHPALQDIQQWADAVNDYAFAGKQQQDLAATGLREQLDSVQKQIGAAGSEANARESELAKTAKALRAQIDQFASRRFLAKDLKGPDNALNKEQQSLAKAISQLGDDQSNLARANYQQWRQSLDVVKFGSPALQADWRKQIAALPSAADATEGAFAAVNARRAQLHHLDDAFAIPESLAKAPWKARAQAVREAELTRAMEADRDSKPIGALADSFRQWCGRAERLKSDLPKLLAPKIDESGWQAISHWWSGGDREFWTKEVEADAFKPMIDRQAAARLDQLYALRDQRPDQLIGELAQAGVSDTTVLAAWDRLAAVHGTSPQLKSAEDIDQWSKILARVKKAAASLPTGQRSSIEESVVAAATQLWIDAVKTAASPATLDAADQLQRSLGFDRPAAQLSPVARYNLLLFDAIHINAPHDRIPRGLAVAGSVGALDPVDRWSLRQLVQRRSIPKEGVPFLINPSAYLWSDDSGKRRAAFNRAGAQAVADARAAIDVGQPDRALAALVHDLDSAPDVTATRAEIDALVKLRETHRQAGEMKYASHDYVGAMESLRAAARGGDGQAMLDLGGMYRDGHGVAARDMGQAEAWFRRSQSAGITAATLELGKLLAERKDPSDRSEALAAFNRLIGNKSTRARERLEAMWRLAGFLVDDDRDNSLSVAANALRDADKADPSHAEPGIGMTMRRLAEAFERHQDKTQARFWYNEAARRKDSMAMAWLNKNNNNESRPQPPRRASDIVP